MDTPQYIFVAVGTINSGWLMPRQILTVLAVTDTEFSQNLERGMAYVTIVHVYTKVQPKVSVLAACSEYCK
jgi:hypothetical protein